MVIKKYLHDKIGTPLMNLLSQGVSPEKLSISIACGAVIGLFPVLGATTLICAAIAIALRLNLVAIQLSNYLVYPLQIALLIPFVRFGAFICQADPPPLSAQELTLLFQQNFMGHHRAPSSEQLYTPLLPGLWCAFPCCPFSILHLSP